MGDRVSVVFKSGAVPKSLAILLGIPMIGILMGAILGNSLYESSRLSQGSAFLAGAGCFGLGVLVAFLTYRYFSEDIQPYIDRVIAVGPAAQETLDHDFVPLSLK